MPFHIGATTVITACAAIAASTALPPRSRIAAPAFDANGDSEATIPVCEITIERPWPRSCAMAFSRFIPSTKNPTIRTSMKCNWILRIGEWYPGKACEFADYTATSRGVPSDPSEQRRHLARPDEGGAGDF